MSTSEERGRLSKSVRLSHEEQVKLAHALKEKDKSNVDIAYIMRISESTVRVLLTKQQGE